MTYQPEEAGVAAQPNTRGRGKKKRSVEVWAQCGSCYDSFSLVIVCLRDEALTVEESPRLAWEHTPIPQSDETTLLLHTLVHRPQYQYCNGKVALFGSLETILDQYPLYQQKRILARGILPRANAASHARRMATERLRAVRSAEGDPGCDASD